MKYCRLIYIVSLIIMSANYVYSQDKRIVIDPNDNWVYRSRFEVEQKAHLPDMTNVRNVRHWRFWYDKYIAAFFVIDVMGPDSLNCKAFITLYTYGDVVMDDKDKFGKLYYEHVNLGAEVARALYLAANQIAIGRFTRKDTVGGVVRGYDVLDALPNTVEFADDKRVIFKTGMKPENITQFNNVINTANKLIDFEKLKDGFEKHIPFGYYSANKWETMNRKLTPKQIGQYNRYWRRHPE
jgi:hypothetical protein